jgi:ABC-type molybdate transport system permease subunit
MINLSAALQNIDCSMEESAQNLGCSGMWLFRRIVLPLALPGYIAGTSLVFLKVFDDLGTPLVDNDNRGKQGSCWLVFRPQNVQLSVKAEEEPGDTIS